MVGNIPRIYFSLTSFVNPLSICYWCAPMHMCEYIICTDIFNATSFERIDYSMYSPLSVISLNTFHTQKLHEFSNYRARFFRKFNSHPKWNHKALGKSCNENLLRNNLNQRQMSKKSHRLEKTLSVFLSLKYGGLQDVWTWISTYFLL